MGTLPGCLNCPNYLNCLHWFLEPVVPAIEARGGPIGRRTVRRREGRSPDHRVRRTFDQDGRSSTRWRIRPTWPFSDSSVSVGDAEPDRGVGRQEPVRQIGALQEDVLVGRQRDGCRRQVRHAAEAAVPHEVED